jgi:hypothetical protein
MIHRSCITVHMPRNVVTSQEQRTKNNPLVLGTFDQLSLRYLRGNLGAKYQVKTNGFGGGTYNNWFQVNLSASAWIIVTKGPPRPQYINVSVYDLNNVPQTNLPVFQADSITDGVNNLGNVYIPYLDTVMSVQSDLYNTFDRLRLDRGDDRYFPLGPGSYLICVSSTRNEPLAYELGLVIEFSINESFFELEDLDGSICLQEDAIDEENAKIILEVGNDEYYTTIHDHSLSEWENAWYREHQDTDRFPEVFIPLTNRP